MYRQDCAQAGYLVLPLGDARHRFMAWQTLAPCLVLIPLTLTSALMGRTGSIYPIGALILGLEFLFYAALFALSKSNSAARQLLFASIIYLPLVFGLMMLGRI